MRDANLAFERHPVSSLPYAVVVEDYTTESSQELAASRGEIVLLLFAEDRGSTYTEWWLYASAADRPADLGCIPASCLNTAAARLAARLDKGEFIDTTPYQIFSVVRLECVERVLEAEQAEVRERRRAQAAEVRAEWAEGNEVKLKETIQQLK